MKHIPNIEYTSRNDLCTGCGVCEGACPSKAIRMEVVKGCFRPVVDADMCRNGKGCHRCYDACPGVGIDLVEECRVFDDEDIKTDRFVGRYLKCYTAHSNEYDVRYHCASGGMVSQMLIWLLETNRIDGAIVTKFDKDAPLMVNSYIATTREEVLEGKSSKYAPVTLNHAIEDIKTAEGNRFVIVGLPCHIEGFRKYEKLDRRFKDKVVSYFAIFCSSGRSFWLTKRVFEERGLDMRKLQHLAYRDNGCLGNMVAEGEGYLHEERFQDYYQPLRSIFVPNRCTMCLDHYGELGDISFGDIHIDPYIDDTVGINSLVVRNRKCMEWLETAKSEGVITLNEIPVETMNRGQVMAPVKKYRNSAFIRFNKVLGKKVPNWGELPMDGNQVKWLVSYLHTNVQQFIGSHKWMWWTIPLIKGNAAKR